MSHLSISSSKYGFQECNDTKHIKNTVELFKAWFDMIKFVKRFIIHCRINKGKRLQFTTLNFAWIPTWKFFTAREESLQACRPKVDKAWSTTKSLKKDYFNTHILSRFQNKISSMYIINPTVSYSHQWPTQSEISTLKHFHNHPYFTLLPIHNQLYPNYLSP